jgi:hypothetical protein
MGCSKKCSNYKNGLNFKPTQGNLVYVGGRGVFFPLILYRKSTNPRQH